jgi:hypothetical protein
MPDLDFRSAPTRPEYRDELARFVSLGVNCELGLVQRHCEIEPLGLFRFGLTPLDGLIQALACDFDGLGDADQIAIEEGFGREYIATHRRYGFEFHTLLNAAEATPQDVLTTVVRHYPFLAGMLLHELSEGKKLFVYRAETPDQPRERERTICCGQYGASVRRRCCGWLSRIIPRWLERSSGWSAAS